jgi:vacuolar-type H+-ATPase subunit H
VTVKSSAPAAFLSYAHVDDECCGGGITEFRKALEGEVRLQTGRDVRIFQDRDSIAWGQEWKARINSSLVAVTFLVPVLTPSFFASDECRRELQWFVDRERRLGRRDLILPVYWISVGPLQHPASLHDDLAQELIARQYTDWRELRFQQLTDPQTRRTLAGLGAYVRDVLDQVGAPNHSAAALRDNVTQAIHHAFDEVRITNLDAVGVINLLVDAIRDSGRLPEYRVRTLRWVCQSRLGRPPDGLRESNAEPLGPDPYVDPANADTFRTATAAVVDATADAVVSTAGDLSVAAALFGAMQEISALPGGTAADGPERALAALRHEVGMRLNAIKAAVDLPESSLHTSIYAAERKAERIMEQAWSRAEEMRAQAEAQARAILDKAQREASSERPRVEAHSEGIDQYSAAMMERIYEILAAEPDKLVSARAVAAKAGIPLTLAKTLLTRLDNAGRIGHNPRAHLYSVRSDEFADPGS